ncbi:MAG: hypothetical protein RLZZ316_266 [Bacteroidota bacterium]|jgi:hypothetical protein
MKFIIALLLTALLCFVACLYLPAWSVAAIAFIVAAFIHQTPLKAFLSGFIALLLLWGLLAFIYSSNNNHVLAHRIAPMIIKKDSPLMLVTLTAFLGALMGGFGALTGSLLRRIKTT